MNKHFFLALVAILLYGCLNTSLRPPPETTTIQTPQPTATALLLPSTTPTVTPTTAPSISTQPIPSIKPAGSTPKPQEQKTLRIPAQAVLTLYVNQTVITSAGMSIRLSEISPIPGHPNSLRPTFQILDLEGNLVDTTSLIFTTTYHKNRLNIRLTDWPPAKDSVRIEIISYTSNTTAN